MDRLAHAYLRMSGSAQVLIVAGLLLVAVFGMTVVHYWTTRGSETLRSGRHTAVCLLAVCINLALGGLIGLAAAVLLRAGTIAPFGSMAGRSRANPSALGTGVLLAVVAIGLACIAVSDFRRLLRDRRTPLTGARLERGQSP